MVKNSIVIGLCMLFQLAACGVQDAERQMLSLEMTVSPVPSATVTPTATATKTPIPTPTLSITPTEFPFATHPGVFPYEISPSGEWIAWSSWGEGYPQLIVENLAGDKSWPATFPDELHQTFCYDVCYLSPAAWSADGNFLYYRVYASRDGLPDKVTRVVGIRRLSLQTGELTDVLPPQQGSPYYFAISPDGGWLVYTFNERARINFVLVSLNDQTRKYFTVDLGDQGLAEMIWSPDNTNLVIGSYAADLNLYINVVNRLDFSVTRYYVGDLLLSRFEWDTASQLRLIPYGSTQSALQINIQTGEITPVEATD